MSGLEILGALASSIAIAQGLEATVKAVNFLRGIGEIQQQCDDLKKEVLMIEAFILEAKKNALPPAPAPSVNTLEHPLIALTAMRLAEIVAELNHIIDRCTSGTRDLKWKPKKWKWIREREAIGALREKARNTKSDLQMAINFRMLSMFRSLHTSHEAFSQSVKLFISTHPQQIECRQGKALPEPPRQVLIQPASDKKQPEESDSDIDRTSGQSTTDDSSESVTKIIPPTPFIPDYHSRYTNSELEENFMQVTAIQPLATRRCGQTCQCRCHWNRREYQTSRWVQPLLGSWLFQFQAINSGFKTVCDEPSCRGGTDAAMKFKYRLPKWLWDGMVSFRAAYNGRPSITASLRPVRTLHEFEIVYRYIRDPVALQKYAEYEFSYFPDDCLASGEGLLEHTIIWGSIIGLRPLLELWKNILPKQGLPRRIGYAINQTFRYSQDMLTEEDTRLLNVVMSFVDEDELEQGTTKVHNAIGRSDIQELKQALWEQPWAIEEVDYTGHAPIHVAVASNDVKALELLMAVETNVNRTTWNGHTPLMLAVRHRALKCLQLLLKHKDCRRRVNQKGRSRYMALHFAVQVGPPEVVAMLLAAGASPIVVTDQGEAPLHRLAFNNQGPDEAIEMVRLLRSSKVDLDWQNGFGVSPVLKAIQRNNLAALHALVEAGASLQTVTIDKLNLFHYTAMYARTEVIRYVMELDTTGVDPKLCSKNGYSPWGLFRRTIEADNWVITGYLRRPSPSAQRAFNELPFRASLRTLQSDLDTLEPLLHAAKQRDEAASCERLATIIKRKEISDRDDLVKWYRGIQSYVKGGSWELAIEEIQSDINEMRQKLSSTQQSLDYILSDENEEEDGWGTVLFEESSDDDEGDDEGDDEDDDDSNEDATEGDDMTSEEDGHEEANSDDDDGGEDENTNQDEYVNPPMLVRPQDSEDIDTHIHGNDSGVAAFGELASDPHDK